MNFWYRFFYALIFPLAKLLYPCKITGREKIPEGPLIVCANHTGLLDPVYIAIAYGRKRQLFFMAKAELFKIPVVKTLFRIVGIFPVDRGRPDINSIRICMKHIKAGERIMLFPEGTRVENSGDVQAKLGAVRIAVKTGALVQPVYVSPNRRKFHWSKLIIGDPFKIAPPENKDYEHLAAQLMDKIYSLENS